MFRWTGRRALWKPLCARRSVHDLVGDVQVLTCESHNPSLTGAVAEAWTTLQPRLASSPRLAMACSLGHSFDENELNALFGWPGNVPLILTPLGLEARSMRREATTARLWLSVLTPPDGVGIEPFVMDDSSIPSLDNYARLVHDNTTAFLVTMDRDYVHRELSDFLRRLRTLFPGAGVAGCVGEAPQWWHTDERSAQPALIPVKNSSHNGEDRAGEGEGAMVERGSLVGVAMHGIAPVGAVDEPSRAPRLPSNNDDDGEPKDDSDGSNTTPMVSPAGWLSMSRRVFGDMPASFVCNEAVHEAMFLPRGISDGYVLTRRERQAAGLLHRDGGEVKEPDEAKQVAGNAKEYGEEYAVMMDQLRRRDAAEAALREAEEDEEARVCGWGHCALAADDIAAMSPTEPVSVLVFMLEMPLVPGQQLHVCVQRKFFEPRCLLMLRRYFEEGALIAVSRHPTLESARPQSVIAAKDVLENDASTHGAGAGVVAAIRHVSFVGSEVMVKLEMVRRIEYTRGWVEGGSFGLVGAEGVWIDDDDDVEEESGSETHGGANDPTAAAGAAASATAGGNSARSRLLQRLASESEDVVRRMDTVAWERGVTRPSEAEGSTSAWAWWLQTALYISREDAELLLHMTNPAKRIDWLLRQWDSLAQSGTMEEGHVDPEVALTPVVGNSDYPFDNDPSGSHRGIEVLDDTNEEDDADRSSGKQDDMNDPLSSASKQEQDALEAAVREACGGPEALPGQAFWTGSEAANMPTNDLLDHIFGTTGIADKNMSSSGSETDDQTEYSSSSSSSSSHGSDGDDADHRGKSSW